MQGALLVAGTTSDAGKSVLVAGLCRWLARQGVDVAPFKAQNMSNNSVVTTDGGEIGRAQALQAAACGLAPSVAFNPVLLKPGSDRTSQVVVHGRVDGSVSALSYRERKPALLEIVTTGLARLRAEHDVVICEGAGSPAEINLRATDIANMGLARAGSLPTIVVGDIDRGGVLAHLFGTVAVLEPADQALISGFVVNKFRGDPALLEPGLAQLERLTGRPTLGVVPFAPDLWIDAEDSLGHDGTVGRPGAPLGRDWLRVAVVRLPRVSNGTDVDALACEPGVTVRYVTAPSDLVGADLVVLPGSKATVSDLAWLRSTGLADAVLAHARAGRPLLGICGGYQMLARTIDDPHGVEAAPGRHEGLGLGAFDVVFDREKHLGNPHGTALGEDVGGYEIHHGRELRDAGLPALVRASDGAPEGLDVGNVLGTHWHGLLENDGFRRRVLARVASCSGRDVAISTTTSFAATRTAQLDLLADLVETHLDTAALTRLIERGAPAGLRIVPPAGAP